MTQATFPDADAPPSVYVFGTCLVDMADPEAGLATLRLLKHAGRRPVFPQGQTCCGQPAYNSGYPQDARAVARHVIGCFPEPWPVVVPSGSCAGMMVKHYPALFADDPDLPAVQAFCDRVIELSQYLVNVVDLHPVDAGPPLRITWHPSCHAMREMGVGDEPKTLLRRLKNVDLVDLERERECCGFGGTFSVRQPEVSAAMVEDKVSDILRSDAATVVSGDCGCLMNISGHLEAKGHRVGSQHLASFLWERIHGR